MITRDYLIRLVEQVVQAIARMLKEAERGDFDAAIAEADSMYDLLGVPRELVDMVDTPTLADLLKHPEKIRAAARLSKREGDVYKLKRDPMTAFAQHRRALELYLEARARDTDGDPNADFDEIRELVALVPQDYLPEEYRS